MEKLHPKAVIFDLGSTLIEYESTPWPELSVLAAASVHRFLDKQGLEVPPEEEFCRLFEEVKSEFRKPAAENLTEWTVPQAAAALLDRIGIEQQDGLAEKIFDAYYKPVGERIFPYDDTGDTLEWVKTKVNTIGLVSNTIFPAQTHLAELRRFKLLKFLDFTIFSSTFGLRKPHPDIFHKAANAAGYSPAECVYIGDRFVEDYQGPTGIGMPAILKILPDREYPPDMPDDVPTITCLSELRNYLDI